MKPEREALRNPSVGPLQTGKVIRKKGALLLGQRQELKSVMISTAVPHDCPHVPNYSRYWKGKGQCQDFTRSQLLGQKRTDSCYRKILALPVQTLVSLFQQQLYRDRKVGAVPGESPVASGRLSRNMLSAWCGQCLRPHVVVGE
jgi:hypothetical protein